MKLIGCKRWLSRWCIYYASMRTWVGILKTSIKPGTVTGIVPVLFLLARQKPEMDESSEAHRPTSPTHPAANSKRWDCPLPPHECHAQAHPHSCTYMHAPHTHMHIVHTQRCWTQQGSCTHGISTIQLPKQDLRNDNPSRQASMDRVNGTPPHPWMKSHRT